MQARHVLPLMGLIVLAGCAGLRDSGPEPPEPQRDILIQPTPDDEEEMTREEAEQLFNPDALGKYDVATIQAAEFTDGEGIHLSRFSRARMFAAVLETLELAEAMSAPQREKLYASLFNGIPARLQGTYRAIAIGQFFSSGEPLYILLGVAEPTDRAPRGIDRTFLLQTSALSNNNRVATYEFGRLVDMTVNVSLMYHINAEGVAREVEAFSVPSRPAVAPVDDEPTDTTGNERDNDAQNEREYGINEQEEAAEHAGIDESAAALVESIPSMLIPAARIRLARRIVETSSSHRVREVPRLVDPLIEDTSVPVGLRAQAMYTRFLYSLSIEQPGEAGDTAERLYDLVQTSYETESEYIDRRLLYRVEHIVPIMLETYGYEQEDSHTFNQMPEAAGEGNGS